MTELTQVGRGKVRELYALDGERLLLVATDRISTFDVVLPTEIPDKGRVLTGLSAFWFARTRELVPNHLLALRDDGPSDDLRAVASTVATTTTVAFTASKPSRPNPTKDTSVAWTAAMSAKARP